MYGSSVTTKLQASQWYLNFVSTNVKLKKDLYLYPLYIVTVSVYEVITHTFFCTISIMTYVLCNFSMIIYNKHNELCTLGMLMLYIHDIIID